MTTTAAGEATTAFAFKPGDLVLIKWNDSMVYFAKIKKIDQRRRKCTVVFDDKSQDEADFSQIHSVDETTTDIICIKCKRDDSDPPNEIVLCDRCGIGYHQKCHSPPIPASALELDTPWNCTYCLRGVKCPYLTESLDVLENLISDEEGHSHDEVDSVTTAESEEGGEEFTAILTPQHRKYLAPPKPQKKRGRKPKVKRGPKPKDRSKSPLVADVQRFKKEDSVDSVDMVPSEEPTSSDLNSSSASSTSQQREMQLRRKRSQIVVSPPPTVLKRPRKPSVQSQTLSVTRISGPVVRSKGTRSDGETHEDMNHETRRSDRFLPGPKLPGAPSMSTNSLVFPERKPRSLRVSLNLPDEVEPGSPMEKVKRSQKLLSPKFALTSLPLWDDDIGPKVTTSVSSTVLSIKSPPSTGGKIITLSSQKSSSESRSPTPKSESGLLTPFTASALPLQATPKTSQEGGERKRKSRQEDKEPVEDSLLHKRPKPTLASPPNSPLEDVFVSPVKTEVAQRPSSQEAGTNTVGMGPPSDTRAVQVNSGKEKESDIEQVILPRAAEAPVGYGQPQKEGPTAVQKPTNDTPSVVTVQPLSANHTGVGTSPTTTSDDNTSIEGAISGAQGCRMSSPQSRMSSPQSQVVSNTVPHSPIPVKSPPDTNPRPPSHLNQSTSVVASSSQVQQPRSATAVSVITSPSTTPTTAVAAIKRKPSPSKSKDNDIIITGVEIRPPHSTSAGVSDLKQLHYFDGLQRSASSQTVCSLKRLPAATSGPVVTAASVKGTHPQTFCLSGKHQRAGAGNRVTSKIAEHSTSAGPVVQQPPPKYVTALSGGGVNRGPGVSSHSVGQQQQTAVSMVGTPTGYTATTTTGATATYTIVPTEAVVSQGLTAIAVQQPPSATNTRAIKPVTLPIKDSVVQPGAGSRPPPQPARTIHYIIEPLVQAATTPIIYSQTAGVPVSVTHTQPSSAVYRTEIQSSKSSMPVTTTKPFAIVPAHPTASIEIQGIAVNQQGTPLISPRVQLGYGPVSTAPYIQTVVTPSSDAKHSIHTPTGSSSSTKQTKENARMSPTVNNCLTHQQNNHEKAQLEEIGKNISNAFASSSEQMLIAAFEDAWKKFQANGKRYQSPKTGGGGPRKTGGQSETGGKPIPPPNAEVVSVPGTTSRLSLIRPTYSRSKISVVQSPGHDQLVCVSADAAQTRLAVATTPDHMQSKQHPVQIIYCSSPSVQQQQLVYTPGRGGTEYSVHAVAPSSSQASYDAVKHQQHRGVGGKSVMGPKTAQVQTSGIYIPGHASEVSLKNTQQQPTTVVIEPVGSGGGLNKSGVVHAPRGQQPIIINERGIPVKQPEQVAVQHLSVLKKPQTILIGGGVDHQRVASKLQQNVGTPVGNGAAVKAARQCALCAKEATYLCSGCHRIWYCGKDCQLKAWEDHSENCRS